MTYAEDSRWHLRDTLAALGLLVSTALVVIWQNAHLNVLWDLSYIVDTAYRITLGQVPYRDFPLAHAPLTFLIQAAMIRLTGRVFDHHVLYAALAGGLASVLTWRILLRTLREQGSRAWPTALLLALPLAFLSIYGIFPTPFYDCDTTFSLLAAFYLLQRLSTTPNARPTLLALTAGTAIVLPVFFKQNIGLPFLLASVAGILALLVVSLFTHERQQNRTLLTVLAGVAVTVVVAFVLLHFTVGLGNYLHWTVTFAAQRRLPGLGAMLEVYTETSLLWTLPAIAIGMLVLHNQSRLRPNPFAARITVTLLFASPFLRTLVLFFRNTESDDRASDLLALWPLVLILAAALALVRLRLRPGLASLLPFLVLAAVNGTLLSQQLWGSTYAIWPLLLILLAGLLTAIPQNLPLAAILSATLLVCGGAYTLSAERLSYADVLNGPIRHATLPALRGISVRGDNLPAFEQLIRFTDANIPANDGILLINGEDPFYFTSGRTPHFPVLLFDPATDPYSPQQVLEEARAHNIRWLIVKRSLQGREDPTPHRAETLQLLLRDFAPYRQLDNYDLYRRP